MHLCHRHIAGGNVILLFFIFKFIIYDFVFVLNTTHEIV